MNNKITLLLLSSIIFITACSSQPEKQDPKDGLEINKLNAEIQKLQNQIDSNVCNSETTDETNIVEKDETSKDDNTDEKTNEYKTKIESLEKELKEADKIISDLNKDISAKDKEIETLKSTTQTADSEKTITVTSPKNEAKIISSPIEFKGTNSKNVEKIVVEAKGPNNSYTDTYTLSDFKSGDTTFWYKADIKFNNLDYGTNEYKFTAYFKDGTTKSETLTIFFLK